MSDGPSPTRDAVLAHNARAWDRLAAGKASLARPAADEAFGDPRSWLGGGGPEGRRPWLPPSLTGLEVLCLAAGGGKHGPLYAAAGARVTVLDLSAAMLEQDREVARERGIDLELVQGSIDHLDMFEPARFDLVVHPVSTCYVPEVEPVFQSVARVTRPGGLYVSQHKHPTSLQAALEPNAAGRYELRHELERREPLPPEPPGRLREAGTQEFIHSLTALLGGICRAGFVIEDVHEPEHAEPGAATGSFGHRAAYLPPYLRILARRRGAATVLVP
jgi:SAM-dependent methyltransferase